MVLNHLMTMNTSILELQSTRCIVYPVFHSTFSTKDADENLYLVND